MEGDGKEIFSSNGLNYCKRKMLLDKSRGLEDNHFLLGWRNMAGAMRNVSEVVYFFSFKEGSRPIGVALGSDQNGALKWC